MHREVLLDLFYHCRNVLCTGIPSLIGGSPDGGLSLRIVSLSWAKLGHPCKVYTFESHARDYVEDGNLLIFGCRERDT